jgi:polyisoprenyl-teichoic acid--peptidoglycan teichoic acid transferase
MATDHPVLGRALLFVTGMLGVVALTVFLFVEPVEIAAWMANPDVLLGIVLINLGLAAIRLFSTGLAWLAGGGRGWVIVGLLLVIVAIPHAAIAWVGLETRDSLVRVFGGGGTTSAALATTTSTTTTTTSTTIPIDLSPVVTAPGQFDEDVITAEPTAPWQPFGTDRLNILLLGGDAGPGRRGLRTDTMIVASIDPISGDAALVGLPRNYGTPTLTDGTPVPVTQLGHVYGWGRRHPEAFPSVDPGAGAVRDVIQHLSGLQIDYYVLVDLTGFADVVDAFGGVVVDVVEPVDGPLYDVVSGGYEMVQIPVGRQHLDGAHALAYSRARYGSSDYTRMGRQRCVLASLATQSDILGLFARMDRILEAVTANLATDLPLEMVPELIRLTPRISTTNIRLIGFDATWGVGRTMTGHVIPDVERIREAVRITIETPAEAGALGVTTADGGC